MRLALAFTRHRARRTGAAVLLLGVAAPAGALTQAAPPGAPPRPIPVRQLVVSGATDSGAFESIFNVRHLRDGRVLVNDISRLQLLILDSTLRRSAPVTDTAGATMRYGSNAGGLIPYVADSTIFYDVTARAFAVIDPVGRVVRVIAMPRPADQITLLSGANGQQGFDPAGRLVFRVTRSAPPPETAPPRPATGTVTVAVRRDSAAIIRLDPALREVDTVAIIGLPIRKSITTTLGTGGTSSSAAINPLPQTDEWTLLPDGTVAVVRAHDYHIDWVGMDGTVTSTPKMPFDWRRVTAEEKQQMLDSAKKAHDERMARAPRPGAMVLGIGGVERPAPALREFVGVDPDDMPDYYPPIRSRTVRADRDGNVWVLPSTSRLTTGGLVYDVVDRKGEVTERVQLPLGRDISAFGPGGIVYLQSYPNPGNPLLERARIAR